MNLNQTISNWLHQWAKEFVNNRARDVINRKLLNSEDLVRSLFAKVQNEPEAGRFMMLFFARSYGRYQDMRRSYTRAGGEEMIQLLEQWVLREGVNKFNKGRYVERFSGQTPQQIANSVAWGISNKIKTIPGTKKRSWFNKGKTHDIENFYDVLLRLAQESVVDELKTAYNGST